MEISQTNIIIIVLANFNEPKIDIVPWDYSNTENKMWTISYV